MTPFLSFPRRRYKYTLTVQEYQTQVLDTSRMMQDMEYPTHYHFMSYMVTPEFSGGNLDVADFPTETIPDQNPARAIHLNPQLSMMPL